MQGVLKMDMKAETGVSPRALWEPTHKNKVSPLRSTPFSTHSGDTRRHQSPYILRLDVL